MKFFVHMLVLFSMIFINYEGFKMAFWLLDYSSDLTFGLGLLACVLIFTFDLWYFFTVVKTVRKELEKLI